MNIIKHYTELALVYGFPDFIRGRLNPGRFQNLCDCLQKECRPALRNLTISETDKWKALEILRDFMKQAGWYKKSKHITTYLSFCLAMIENSQFRYNQRIITILNALITHLENGDFLYEPCCWAGDLAAQKWEGMFCNETM